MNKARTDATEQFNTFITALDTSLATATRNEQTGLAKAEYDAAVATGETLGESEGYDWSCSAWTRDGRTLASCEGSAVRVGDIW